MLGFAQRSSYVVTDLKSCNCFSEGLDFFLGIRHRAVGRGKSHDLRVPAYPTPCPPHSVTMSHTWGVADLSHRSQSPPTVLSACDIPKWLGPAGLAKNAAWTKINLPHSLAAPCPFPLSSHPSSLQSLPGKAEREGERESRVEEVLRQPNPEKERERGREEEKERERSPYMGTCADNVWQWLRGQQRADTRQMEEIKHGTERVPGPWKQLLFHSEFAQNLARFPFLPKPSKMCVLNSTWLWVRPLTLAGWGLNPLKSFLWRTKFLFGKKKKKTGLVSQEFPISLQST